MIFETEDSQSSFSLSMKIEEEGNTSYNLLPIQSSGDLEETDSLLEPDQLQALSEFISSTVHGFSNLNPSQNPSEEALKQSRTRKRPVNEIETTIHQDCFLISPDLQNAGSGPSSSKSTSPTQVALSLSDDLETKLMRSKSEGKMRRLGERLELRDQTLTSEIPFLDEDLMTSSGQTLDLEKEAERDLEVCERLANRWVIKTHRLKREIRMTKQSLRSTVFFGHGLSKISTRLEELNLAERYFTEQSDLAELALDKAQKNVSIYRSSSSVRSSDWSMYSTVVLQRSLISFVFVFASSLVFNRVIDTVVTILYHNLVLQSFRTMCLWLHKAYLQVSRVYCMCLLIWDIQNSMGGGMSYMWILFFFFTGYHLSINQGLAVLSLPPPKLMPHAHCQESLGRQIHA